MSSALDRSLDDLIKTNKQSAGGNPRGGRGSGPGPDRRGRNRAANRAVPYAVGKPAQAPDSAWQHDMYSDQPAAYPAPGAEKPAAIETGTKLYISNLDYGVSNEDIKELFSEVGDLKRFSIHYDRSGRSKGTAEVVFSRRGDAVAAVKRYNNVQLDGKPMKIDIVGTNIVTSATSAAPTPQETKRAPLNPGGVPKSVSARSGSSTGPSQVGGSRKRARGGRKQKKAGSKPLSAADLDADLENYHSEAMHTN